VSNGAAPSRGTDHEGAVGALADRLFRHESARLRAGLIRRLGASRLDLADDVVQETLLAALKDWRFRGVPENPSAWLTRVAQRKAVDVLRHDRRDAFAAATLATWGRDESRIEPDDGPIRLMFLCGHPLLAEPDRVMLTLSLAAGFSVEEIARAFLISPPAAEQRLVRAKRTLRDSGATLDLPDGEIPARVGGVLATLYLMLNEGYAAHGGDRLVRRELMDEARRLLGMLLASPLVPEHDRAEVHAVASLAAFLAARSETRTDAAGGLVLLEDQDRSRWDRAAIGGGFWHLARSTAGARLSAYGVEAALAGAHAAAPTFDDTDWGHIVDLYDLLAALKPTGVVLLNRAAAVAMRDGPEAGLTAMDAIPLGALRERYHLVEAVRGEILRRAGRRDEAAASFRCALSLPCSHAERGLIASRLAAVEPGPPKAS
jgi:RNA polymerase sigma-70 factor, ECF subfamily